MTLLEEYFRKTRGIATLPETNIAPEKMAPQTEINVPTINFQGLFLTVSGRVLYSQEHVVMRILAKRNPKACWKLLTHWNLSCFSSCEIQATRYRHLTRIFVWCPRDGWGVKMVVMVWFWREANHFYNHVSNEKKPSCLEYIGIMLCSYMVIIIKHYKDPYCWTMSIFWECIKVGACDRYKWSDTVTLLSLGWNNPSYPFIFGHL